MTDAERAHQAILELRKTTRGYKDWLHYPYKKGEREKTPWFKALRFLDEIDMGVIVPPARISPFGYPGFLTDTDATLGSNPPTLEKAKALLNIVGPDAWVVQQAQNGDQLHKDVDLESWRSAGFKTRGVWGVTYSPGNFVRDGKAIGQRARETSSTIAILDAEECLKNADPRPLIQAAMNEFVGPWALTTYGAASGTNIFPIDYKAFVDAGWDILPQAYRQISPEYAPKRCIEHMKQVAARDGINELLILKRTHLMIYTSMTASDINTPVTGIEQVALLHAAGVGKDVSIFMPEYEYDYEALRPIFGT